MPAVAAGRDEELCSATTNSAEARPAVGEALVRLLVDGEFPQRAGLPVKFVDPVGAHRLLRRGLRRRGGGSAAARRLSLSVRALTYHLKRVHQPIGAGPADPVHRYTPRTAVIGARLLDRPSVHF